MAQITQSGTTIHTPVSTFNYETRYNELAESIKGLVKNIGVKNFIIKLSDRFAFTSAYAKLYKNQIKLSPLFLLKYEDIPERWRGITQEDPRLVDAEFLEEVRTKIYRDFFKETHPNLVMRDIYIHTFLLSLRDPILFEKAKEFIIAHELFHMKHCEMWKDFQASKFLNIIKFICPGVETTPLTPSERKRIEAFDDAKYALIREKYADKDAAKALKGAEGAIYLFSTRITSNKAFREIEIFRNDFDEQGNVIGDNSHPTLTDRIKYLQAWQTKQTQKSSFSSSLNDNQIE